MTDHNDDSFHNMKIMSIKCVLHLWEINRQYRRETLIVIFLYIYT